MKTFSSRVASSLIIDTPIVTLLQNYINYLSLQGFVVVSVRVCVSLTELPVTTGIELSH